MCTVADKVPFRDLCKLCEKISNKQNKNEKRKLLVDFINHWREFHDHLHVNDPAGGEEDSFFSAMRLLLPHLDKERPAYGIKETTLARLYIQVLALGKDSADAQKLLNYKAPKVARAEAGDFASVAYVVLKNRCPIKGSLTVSDVNRYLDEISNVSSERNKEDVEKKLCSLLQQTSASEQRWLIRMILKDMKMGVSEHSVLNAYHPDARDLFDVTSNLAKVCLQLKDTNFRLHEAEISLFSPFRPMLAERAEPKTVERQMNHEPFFVETKFDGERLQVHKDGDIFKYFSRGSKDYSSSFGESNVEGSLTQHIVQCFKNDVTSCILDGEIVAYDPAGKEFVCKGANIDVKSLRTGSRCQPCFVAFDILMLNGHVLTNKPLRERVLVLDSSVIEKEGRLMVSKRKHGTGKEDAIKFLNEAIDNREEGILIKNVNSVYKPNTRKGGWLKLKPEYVANLVSDLDLIILGGYYGEGHRSGDVSHFLLGVASDQRDRENNPVSFWSFAKVGSGYSREELDELLSKLKSKWKVYNTRCPPTWIVLAPGHKERPDLYVEPRDSFVVQVKASEMTKSDRFRTEVTLRFPRVVSIRYDKPWYDVLTFREALELDRKAAGKLAVNPVLNDDDEVATKKPRIQDQLVEVARHFRATDTSRVAVQRDVLEGKEVCIVTGCQGLSKQDLEVLVVQNGGTVVQNPGQGTFCVVAGKDNFRVKSLLRSKRYDVVKAECFGRRVESGDFELWEPFDLWGKSADTKRRLDEVYDEYGDSYTAEVTCKKLRCIFDGIPEDKLKGEQVDANFMRKFETEEFVRVPSWAVFRKCVFYFVESVKASVLLRMVKLCGGKVAESVIEDVTHIVVAEGDTWEAGKKYGNMGQNSKVVSESWVRKCFEMGEIV
ncbi:DNA ligase 4-like [Ornithodoros turicata]|uniref:DNA ligase 4-like n=1 Tax=Ornithodoros turicata TaxID=34597 RepID=UPI00313A3C9A